MFRRHSVENDAYPLHREPRDAWQENGDTSPRLWILGRYASRHRRRSTGAPLSRRPEVPFG
jgi:hypothetical protein